MRFVPINCAKEGTFLAQTLFDEDGRVLLAEGARLTLPLIERIKSIGIHSIYIKDEYSANEIEDVIKPQLRQKAIKVLRETFQNLQQHVEQTAGIQKNAAHKKQQKMQELHFQSLQAVAKEILDQLMSSKNLLINLVDIKSMDNYTYQHCVNVAILSLVMGIRLQYNTYQLYELCMGALLHDIGKVFVPKEIILKPGKLTTAELDSIQQHPRLGYNYVKDSYDVPGASKVIILQHHEKADGGGYPDGRTAEATHPFSKVVAIADVYDALTSDRPYRRALSPSEALEYIMGCGGSHFDYELVEVFCKIIIPYPVGTYVQLSSKDIAVIEEIQPLFPLRPKVKIIRSENLQKIDQLIDLLHEMDLVILGIQYEI